MINKRKFKKTEIGFIPEDWTIGCFSEDLTIKGRIGWKGYKTEDLKEKGPIVLGGENIKSSYFINYNNVKHLSPEKFNESPEIMLTNGDVLLVTRGNLGEVAHFKGEYKEVTINPSLVILKDFVGNSTFLFYFLISPNGIDQISSIKAGSSVPAIYQSEVKKIKYPKPLLSEQKAIAKILSDLDEKIELNKKMNQTLEEIGKTLFKRWFVDFEFLNEKGEPYKSSGGEMVYNEELKKEIPKGWSVGHFGDNILTSFIKVGVNKFKNQKIYIATANINNSYIINYNTKIYFLDKPSRANMQPTENTVWFAKMKESNKKYYFDKYNKWEIKNIILSTGFAGFNIINNYALYYIWNFLLLDNFEKIKDNFCNGTTMQGINNESIKKINYFIPDREILIKYNNLVANIFVKISNNKKEHRFIEQIRDYLLPKLMYGKIRVKY